MPLTVVAFECETEEFSPTTRALSGKGMALTKLETVEDRTVHHGHKQFGLHVLLTQYILIHISYIYILIFIYIFLFSYISYFHSDTCKVLSH